MNTRIVFLKDYAGIETNHIRYQAGAVVQIPDRLAQRLIEDGTAQEYQEPKPAKKEKPVE